MAQQTNYQLSPRDRDVLIRTVIGEAANEGSRGWAAVAHVVRNRQGDPRWPSSAAGVAKQPWQFSAWNAADKGGNNLVRSYGPESKLYQQVGSVVDRVYAGQVPDETGGAVYYYAPNGMPGRRSPRWWGTATAESGGHVVIGNHRFAGKGAGTQGMTNTAGFIANGSAGAAAATGTNAASTGGGMYSGGYSPRPRARGASGASGLFPAFSSTIKNTNQQVAASLTGSLFESLSTGTTPVGKFDNLFGAFENG